MAISKREAQYLLNIHESSLKTMSVANLQSLKAKFLELSASVAREEKIAGEIISPAQLRKVSEADRESAQAKSQPRTKQ